MPLLEPPAPVLEIAARLETAGFEAWCVGGAVRDAMLGHPHLDWDLATSATPTEVRKLFGSRRTIPIGLDFGTVGVLDETGTMHEVTTFRRDVQTDGRHAVVEFGVSLDDDLARRDFTINAIAYSPSRDELRDPFGGRADLERRVVRAVGVADERMAEDRLRALRAIRFAARFGFAIERETLDAIARSAPYLGRLSAERVKQELDKTMEQVRRPSEAFGLWKRTGALATLIPALEDITDETLRALDCLAMPGVVGRPQRRLTRFAMLFLSLPQTRLRDALGSLRLSRSETGWITGLSAAHHRIGAEVDAALASDVSVPDAQIRRWVAAIEKLRVMPFMRLALASRAARTAGSVRDIRLAARGRRLYRRMLWSAFHDPLVIADLALDGDDIRRGGIPAGPILGKILQQLTEQVIEDPSRNRADWLLQEAQRLYRERPDGRDG
jgi:tRNA nucleotidyltransferase (CCA-adding enzyme)